MEILSRGYMRYLEEGGAQERYCDPSGLNIRLGTSHFTHLYIDTRIGIKLGYRSSDLGCIVAAALYLSDSYFAVEIGQHFLNETFKGHLICAQVREDTLHGAVAT